MELLVSLSSLLVDGGVRVWLRRGNPRGMVCHPSVFLGLSLNQDLLGRADTVGGPWCSSRLLLVLAKGPWTTREGPLDWCNWVPARVDWWLGRHGGPLTG